MRSFREDVQRAVAYHGHLCSGQCIGVKMAHLGLKTLGLDNETDGKKIMVFVECDRCPADAISVVTGCKIGKRTLKAMDYGKIAATFLNLETGRAVRVRRKNRLYPEPGQDMINFYENLPDSEILAAEEVRIDLRPCDMPGTPVEVAYCQQCGEDVTDGRHVIVKGRTLCKNCAGQGYYRKKQDQ